MDLVTPSHVAGLATLPHDHRVADETRGSPGVVAADEQLLCGRARGRPAATGVSQAQSYLEIERC
jgi:hypothetical protein